MINYSKLATESTCNDIVYAAAFLPKFDNASAFEKIVQKAKGTRQNNTNTINKARSKIDKLQKIDTL